MKDFEKAYKSLNIQQKEAVDTIEGPVMVVAGPGTGKTQILALRIANILRLTDVEPFSILCLTFTESGVRAMRERLTKYIGSTAYQVSINTFHSFSNEIIQNFPEKFVFAKELKQLDDLKKMKILKEVIEELSKKDVKEETEIYGFPERKEKKWQLFPFSNKFYNLYNITSSIQTLKKEGIDFEDLQLKVLEIKKDHLENVQEYRGKPTGKWKTKLEKIEKMEELFLVYQNYQRKLEKEGFYDYEDMIMFVLDELQNDDVLLSYYQEKFLYILVDEYQDTNGAQNKLIEILGSFERSPNIFVVGDDDQAIYRFQGANLGNILFFAKHFESVKMISVGTNYRSSQLILDIADSLVSNNSTRLVSEYEDLQKKLTAAQNIPEIPAEIWEFNNADEENIFLSEKIKELNASGVNYEDIAILYRKNSHAEDINNVLVKNGIPTKLDSSANVFESNQVNKLLEIFEAINFGFKISNELFYRILLFDFFELKPVSVYKLNDFARQNKKSIFDVILQIQNGEEIQIDEFEKIKEIVNNLFELHKLKENLKPSKFLEILLEKMNILNFLNSQTEDTSENQISSQGASIFSEILSINSFFNYVKQQEELNYRLTLSDLILDIKTVQENNIKVALPKSDIEKDAVNLMTAHSSKGLEFKYVFIVKASDINWGSKRSTGNLMLPEIYKEDTLGLDEKDLALEDERRLFFVAITRAKEKVFFTYAKEYETYGSVSQVNQSQFLSEIDTDEKIKKFSVDNNDFEISIDQYTKLLSPINEQIFSLEEEEYLKDKINNFKLSPSALNAYLESPAKFKDNFLLRVPKAKTKELALGTAIHQVFEKLNRSILNNSKRYPSEETLIEWFHKAITDEFFGHEDFDQTLSEGISIIKEYFEKYLRSGQYKIPIFAEYSFGFNNIFLTRDGENPVALTGKIDKVELLDELTNSVKIIDYKTAKPKSENEIKGLTKTSDGSYWRQLVFYKLLTSLDPKFRPGKNQMKSKYIVSEVEIDFLRKNQSKKYVKRSFSVLEDDISKLKDLIFEVMKKIRNLEFPEEQNIDYESYL